MSQNKADLVLHDTGKRKTAVSSAGRFLLMFVLAFGVEAAMAAGGFAKLDLFGMHEAIAVLSGNTANVELLHRTMEEYGEDVRDWYRPFVTAATKDRADFGQAEN